MSHGTSILHRCRVAGEANATVALTAGSVRSPAAPPAATVSAVVPMDPHTRYELVEVIGKGSFGEVYRG